MKEKDYKLVAIFALIVSVLALAVGFASYSTMLSIQNTSVNVLTGDDPFSPNIQYKANSLECVRDSTGASVEDVGLFDNNEHATIWKGAAITLNGPGDSITCRATVENRSSFTAYFNQVVLANHLTCSGSNTIQNMEAACQAIHLSVKIAGNEYGVATSSTYSGSDTISNLTMVSGGEKEVSFTISYDVNGASANENFLVTIPTIQFVTGTAD